MINTFVFLGSAAILSVTATLFYLLDEQGDNPAGLFALLCSAAIIASALVAVHRLGNQLFNNGRETWPSTMAIGIPLMFLTCAIIAFVIFVIGLNITALKTIVFTYWSG
ncbi:hypothetical protein GSI_01278 [Ganoderma sinense ZZ0214-1]|uniref:Uncharacterized protein n=1 Tax=Ganoderma sinense ZZ0214-1 TaxID=1077348 RepID=A0A2G8SV01_9APHY|nr:hypothetical protein GSI_01278 [Ganoderma sinense ZZ0214-1]